MNNEQAIKTIEQALQAANVKGCFGLQDSAVIFTAFKQLETIAKYEFVNYGTGLISSDIYDKITSKEKELTKSSK